MEVEELYKQLNINNKKVLTKAREYVLRIKVKRPSGIGGSESCKNIACLYISCKDLGVPFDKSKVLSFMGKSEALFHNAVTSIYTILGIKRQITISQLNEKLQLNNDIIRECENLLDIFKNKVLGGIQEVQKKFVDVENGLFSAACICVMVNQHSIVIDNSILTNLLGCSHEELQKAVDVIIDHCYKGSEHLKIKKTPPKSLLKNSPKSLNSPLQVTLPKKPVGKLIFDNDSCNNKEVKKDNSNNNSKINNINNKNIIDNKDNSVNNNDINNNNSNNSNNNDDNSNSNNKGSSKNEEINDSIQINEVKTNSILNKRNREEKEVGSDGADLNSCKYIKNDGDLTMEEERNNIKKRKDNSFKEWMKSDFVQNNIKQVSKPTKQLTLDSFFK